MKPLLLLFFLLLTPSCQAQEPPPQAQSLPPIQVYFSPKGGCTEANVRYAKNRELLTEDKILCLDALGFCWVIKPHGIKVPWKQRIIDLKAFKKKHGHCMVPRNYQPNPALGKWVSNLRQRNKRGELAEDKILLLDALGFCWERQTTWGQRINDLKLFKKEYGHCNVPSVYPPNLSLGHWVFKMRQQKKLGTLAEDRILILDGLGFVWEGLKRWRPKQR